MKKITLLLSFIACVMVAQGQTNLLVNPSFVTWANGAPTGWTLPTNTFATVSQNTTLFNDGVSSLKVTAGPVATGGTYTINQSIPVTVGKTYTLSMSYYIETGDNTDARIWCNFKNGTTYLTDAEMTSAGLFEKLKGPGGSGATFYFPDVKGSWQTYSVEFVAPAGVTDFNFEFRTYKEPAIVNWDKMFFGEKTTGFSNLTASNLEVSLVGKKLTVTNSPSSSVEIFSALGVKIQTVELVNGSANLDLSKGLYIVRAGKKAAKIMIQK